MKKYDDSLFQIGEVAKILGVTRKMILNYEDLGLLTPAVKDDDSGYRYYTADNMTQIRSIRSLQALGLSLKEVAEYYYDTANVEMHLQRLMELRTALDRNIQMLQVRAAKPGDLTVRRVTLPRQVCFCRRHLCANTAEAAIRLRDTYIAAARTGLMSMNSRMFTIRAGSDAAARTGLMSMNSRMFTIRAGSDAAALDLLCCIPVSEEFEGPERREFPETPALCIYYRGPYEGTISAIQALVQYVQENQIKAAGGFRSIYMEGPPSRGVKTDDYITQVAVPIEDRRREA